MILDASSNIFRSRIPIRLTLSDQHPELDSSGLRSPAVHDSSPFRLERPWANLRELRNGAKEWDVDNESKPAAPGGIALSIESPIERRTWIGIMDVCFPLGISLAACKRESGSGSSQRAGPLDLRCMGPSRLSRSSLRCSGDFLTWMLRHSIQGPRTSAEMYLSLGVGSSSSESEINNNNKKCNPILFFQEIPERLIVQSCMHQYHTCI